jgi:hypothetical protein
MGKGIITDLQCLIIEAIQELVHLWCGGHEAHIGKCPFALVVTQLPYLDKAEMVAGPMDKVSAIN